MSSTITHAVTASFIALTCSHVAPGATTYVIAALVSGCIVDLDHLPSIIRDWKFYRQNGFTGNIHRSRSVLHELIGLLAVGALSGLLFLNDHKLASIVFIAFAIHLVQDWLLGKTQPFRPFDCTFVQFFKLTAMQKVFIDLATLAVFGGLWILYLSGDL